MNVLSESADFGFAAGAAASCHAGLLAMANDLKLVDRQQTLRSRGRCSARRKDMV